MDNYLLNYFENLSNFEIFFLLIGLIAQITFASRFIVQWLYSEKIGGNYNQKKVKGYIRPHVIESVNNFFNNFKKDIFSLAINTDNYKDTKFDLLPSPPARGGRVNNSMYKEISTYIVPSGRVTDGAFKTFNNNGFNK